MDYKYYEHAMRTCKSAVKLTRGSMAELSEGAAQMPPATRYCSTMLGPRAAMGVAPTFGPSATSWPPVCQDFSHYCWLVLGLQLPEETWLGAEACAHCQV